MHTLYDFICQVNGIQYLLAILFIAGFIIFFEIFKPKPFMGLSRMINEDVSFVKEQGKSHNLQVVKNALTGSAYAMLYVVALPLLFMHGIAVLMSKLFTSVTYIGWSPVQAYFTGRRRAKKSPSKNTGTQDSR